MELTENLKKEIKEHSLLESPNECCGVFLREKGKIIYHKLINNSTSPNSSFAISYYQLKDTNRDNIVGYFHSHKEGGFSSVDIQISEKTMFPSIIYKIKEDDFEIYNPVGLEIPLIGRNYIIGIFDCIVLIRDYFERKFNIKMGELSNESTKLRYTLQGDLERSECNFEGNTIFIDYFLFNGFVKVEKSQIKAHDIILIRHGGIKFASHAMIYIGNGQVMRHCYQISDISPYSELIKRLTVCVLRHKLVN